MPADSRGDVDFQTLKRKAESRIEEWSRTQEWQLEFSPPADDADLLHELQVHQVELMMQNEELLRAHRQLTESRDHYQRLFNATPLGYVLLDEQGEILEQNDPFYALVNKPGGRLRKASYFVDHIHTADRPIFRARYRAFFRQPDGKSLELDLVRGDQERLPVRLLGCRFQRLQQNGDNKGTREALLISVMDLSQERQLERRVRQKTDETLFKNERMAGLGMLVDSFTHDLCSLLEGAQLSVQALEEALQQLRGSLAASRTQASGIDEAAHCHLQQAVADLRGLAAGLRTSTDKAYRFKRSSIDQMQSRSRLFNLAETLSDLASSLHARLEQQQVGLHITCPPEIRVQGVPGTLDQLFLNLMVNSLGHAFEPGQTGRMEVSVIAQGTELVIEHRDDGCGIPAPVKERVFERFFTTSKEGSGLGLYILKSVVENQLGGNLGLESQPGQGTRVWIRLPLRQLHGHPTVLLESAPSG